MNTIPSLRQLGQVIAPIVTNDHLNTFTLDEFANFKHTVSAFTQDNQHGLALEYIARRFKFTKLITAFDVCHKLAQLPDKPQELMRLREAYASEMKKLITRYYGAVVADEIEECL